mgnify:CR=1 FL=1
MPYWITDLVNEGMDAPLLRYQFTRSSPPVVSRTYFRSAPAQNARPLPVSTTARTPGSSCARSSAASMPRTISGVIEFSAAGRFRVIHIAPARACDRTAASLIVASGVRPVDGAEGLN